MRWMRKEEVGGQYEWVGRWGQVMSSLGSDELGWAEPGSDGRSGVVVGSSKKRGRTINGELRLVRELVDLWQRPSDDRARGEGGGGQEREVSLSEWGHRRTWDDSPPPSSPHSVALAPLPTSRPSRH